MASFQSIVPPSLDVRVLFPAVAISPRNMRSAQRSRGSLAQLKNGLHSKVIIGRGEPLCFKSCPR